MSEQAPTVPGFDPTTFIEGPSPLPATGVGAKHEGSATAQEAASGRRRNG
jgi:hypothetical protein